MLAFSAGDLALTCFCYIANLSSIFSLLFGFFSNLQCRFYENIYYANIFLHYCLKSIKFATENNPRMQLRYIFQKKLNKLKVGKFQSRILSTFSAINIGRGWENVFFVFMINFVCTNKFLI